MSDRTGTTSDSRLGMDMGTTRVGAKGLNGTSRGRGHPRHKPEVTGVTSCDKRSGTWWGKETNEGEKRSHVGVRQKILHRTPLFKNSKTHKQKKNGIVKWCLNPRILL